MGTATTRIYTLSLHDALPISETFRRVGKRMLALGEIRFLRGQLEHALAERERSEEHTSELQSRRDLVCRLLLEKKNILTVTAVSLRNATASPITFCRPTLISK